MSYDVSIEVGSDNFIDLNFSAITLEANTLKFADIVVVCEVSLLKLEQIYYYLITEAVNCEIKNVDF